MQIFLMLKQTCVTALSFFAIFLTSFRHRQKYWQLIMPVDLGFNEWLADAAYSADGKHLDTIPYPETEHYTKKVQHIQKIYLWLYADRIE